MPSRPAPQQPMQIGAVAEQTGLSIRTIRFYEEMELMVPSAHTSGGFRLYTDVDVERLQLIKRMKPLDFSLDEMRHLLQLVDALEATQDPATSASLLAQLRELHDDVLARVTSLRAKLGMAEEFAANLDAEMKRHLAKA